MSQAIQYTASNGKIFEWIVKHKIQHGGLSPIAKKIQLQPAIYSLGESMDNS